MYCNNAELLLDKAKSFTFCNISNTPCYLSKYRGKNKLCLVITMLFIVLGACDLVSTTKVLYVSYSHS